MKYGQFESKFQSTGVLCVKKNRYKITNKKNHANVLSPNLTKYIRPSCKEEILYSSSTVKIVIQIKLKRKCQLLARGSLTSFVGNGPHQQIDTCCIRHNVHLVLVDGTIMILATFFLVYMLFVLQLRLSAKKQSFHKLLYVFGERCWQI